MEVAAGAVILKYLRRLDSRTVQALIKRGCAVKLLPHQNASASTCKGVLRLATRCKGYERSIRMEPQHQRLNEMMAPDQAEATLLWIRGVKNGSIRPPQGFNWFGMAEFSADNARCLNSMQWARVSLEVYEWPDWKIEWGWGSNAYISEAMSIRQQFIHELGADGEHDVLNPDRVQELFLQSLPAVSVAEALSIFRSYRQAEETKVNRRANREAFYGQRIGSICAGLRVLESLAEDNVALWLEVEQWMAVKVELCAVPPHNLKGRPVRRTGILKSLWLSLIRRW